MPNRNLPKGKWFCTRCGQEFCTPVSCLAKIKQLREERAHLSAPNTPASSDANNSQGGMTMSKEQVNKPAGDQSQQKLDTGRQGDPIVVLVIFGVCSECNYGNGQHDRACSQNIANVI